jgi:hypothetical protein
MMLMWVGLKEGWIVWRDIDLVDLRAEGTGLYSRHTYFKVIVR